MEFVAYVQSVERRTHLFEFTVNDVEKPAICLDPYRVQHLQTLERSTIFRRKVAVSELAGVCRTTFL